MTNADQIEYWNGDVGQKWLTHAEQLDALLAPFIDDILSAAALTSGETVMDIGCGGGTLSFAAADQISPGGEIIGVDVSEPLIALAQQRAKTTDHAVRFETADASVYRPGQLVDAVISRFGVMFFNEPVGAFSNIRTAVQPGGRLAFVCWQSLQANLWARSPLEAIIPLLPEPPPMPALGTPGPFAFGDKDYVASILHDGGWSDVSITSKTAPLVIPGASPREAAEFMLLIGPAARLLSEADLPRAPALDAIEQAFSHHIDKTGRVALPSAVWIVTARNP